MKHKIIILLCTGIMVLSGCTSTTPKQETETTSQPAQTTSESETETSTADTKEQATTQLQIDDNIYIGEYLDSAINEPNLEVAKGDGDTYIIQIGIYRLTFLSDGVGELTAEGMYFTATDASGNPISGIITIEGETATVTFTDSTWEYLENGSSFEYIKSSDTPNIWDN